MNKQIDTFYIFSRGEPAAGIVSTSATVFLPMPPHDTEEGKEYLETVIAELKRAFSVIFDDKHVRVITNLEVDDAEECVQ